MKQAISSNGNFTLTALSVLLPVLLLLQGCSQEQTAEEAFAAGNYTRAFSLWKSRSASGEAKAQNYLGIHYYMGLGVRRDLAEAFRWFDSAAKQGHPQGQRHLGMMYHNGYGTTQNFTSAFSWYYAAYRQGSPTARRYMDALAGENKLSPNQMNQAKSQVRPYIINSVVNEEASEGKLFRGQQAQNPF